MPLTEFEEKTFEVASNNELSFHHPSVYAPGQVLESVLGFDAAANQPQNSPIWTLLNVPAPVGLQLVPNFWNKCPVQPKAANLPSTFVSLLIQYKRPMHLLTAHAKQWALWNAPFYRYETTPHQHSILRSLEVSLAPRAHVYYSSPTFDTLFDLLTHTAARAVLAQSNFVLPSMIGNHTVWTYNANGTVGLPNPSRKQIRCSSFKDILAAMREGGRRENLYQHLRGLAIGNGITALDPTGQLPDWLMAIGDRYIAQDFRPTQATYDLIELGRPIGETGTTWFIADLEA
jgi:hypothetical protein